ncbi:MAG: PEGA domain-containing protein [Gammaproteobacteria bacterium]|nr:PEGA domain-containing protein [Gammaproteobacteria bacterium]
MKRVLAMIAIGLILSNCATITRGTTDAFTITSDPTGADIRLSNGLVCRTPCALEVKRRPGFVVTVEKEGYRTVTTSVVSSISGGGGTAMAGNVLLGGIIGAGVDASNGSMNELSPNPLHVVLEVDSAITD